MDSNLIPSCIASSCLNHYATSVHSSVIEYHKTMTKYTRQHIPDTWYLLIDVGRRARVPRRPRSGHDVTGPDINLNFPDANLKFRCLARLGSSDVAPDRRPTEKQAPAGKLAGFGALGTGRSASESWRSRAGRRYTDSTCHDCHCDQQRVETGHNCICHRLGTIRFARAAGLTLWFIHVQQGRDEPKTN